jgi:hypothetical protein
MLLCASTVTAIKSPKLWYAIFIEVFDQISHVIFFGIATKNVLQTIYDILDLEKKWIHTTSMKFATLVSNEIDRGLEKKIVAY